MKNVENAEKLDNTFKRTFRGLFILIPLIWLGTFLLKMFGDKRTAKLLQERRKEIYWLKKNSKIDLTVESKEAIENQVEKIEEIQIDFDRMNQKTAGLTKDEVFKEWQKRSQ